MKAGTSEADRGRSEGIESWCVYVLEGILGELKKLDRLCDHVFLRTAILQPALAHAREREFITSQEHTILQLLSRSDTGVAKSADLAAAMPGLSAAQRSYQIKKLVEQGMLVPIQPNARQYTLGFTLSDAWSYSGAHRRRLHRAAGIGRQVSNVASLTSNIVARFYTWKAVPNTNFCFSVTFRIILISTPS